MNTTPDIKVMIEKFEQDLIPELKEDYNTLSFIRGFVYTELNLPENMSLLTGAQQVLLLETGLEVIFYLLNNRGCKVYWIEHEDHGNWGTLGDFIEWDLPPEEAIKKIREVWLNLKEPMNPALQPWFAIDADPTEKE